jgi:hypothetical protein
MNGVTFFQRFKQNTKSGGSETIGRKLIKKWAGEKDFVDRGLQAQNNKAFQNQSLLTKKLLTMLHNFANIMEYVPQNYKSYENK